MSEFESVAIVPGSDENDEVWVAVKRTINGSTVRYIERFKSRDFDTANDAWFVDCGTDSTDYSHLEGETVNILADGVKQPQQTVTSGAIDNTAFSGATNVYVGLPITYQLQPMKLNIADLAFITRKNIVKTILSVHRALGGKIGPDSSNLDDIPYTATTYDTGPGLNTGIIPLAFGGGFSDSGDILIYGDDPLPMTIRAIGVKVGVERD